MLQKLTILIVIFVTAVSGMGSPNSKTVQDSTAKWVDPLNETKEQRDARMKWWREAKFGMFIHWGVYAVPAGTYNGRRIGFIGEWIMQRAKIPVADYKAFAQQFNPVKYDPEAWVELAKEAGMKYIVITAKHHEGFALFPSKASKWNIVDATPYGKDLLRPLEKACKKNGIKLGFYYSQAQDWVNPGGSKPKGEWDPAQKGDFDEYLKNIAYPQVKELLTGYDIDILWWDTPIGMTKERAEYLRELLPLKPGLITNNRLGGRYKGDTDTPEQHVPAKGFPGRDWESCMTMNDTWGYKSYDNHWKSTETLIRHLVDIASKGGNYLLNIGPTAEGEFPPASVERLKAIGKWMKVNGDAIYSTTASPCRAPEWGRITKKILEDGKTRLYLCVYDWPENGMLEVPVKNKTIECYLLADKSRRFKISQTDDGTFVHVTGDAPDKVCSVIVMDIEGKPDVIEHIITGDSSGKITFPAVAALINNVGYSQHAVYTKDDEGGYIQNLVNSRCGLEWDFNVDGKKTTFNVELIASCEQGDTDVEISVGRQKLGLTMPKTESDKDFVKIDAGKLTLNPGRYVMKMRISKRKNKIPVNVKSVTFKPEL